MFIKNYGDMKIGNFQQYLISFVLILLRFSLIFKGFQRSVSRLLHHFRIWLYWISSDYTILLKLLDGVIQRFGSHMNIPIHCCFDAGMTQQFLQHLRLHTAFDCSCSIGMSQGVHTKVFDPCFIAEPI